MSMELHKRGALRIGVSIVAATQTAAAGLHSALDKPRRISTAGSQTVPHCGDQATAQCSALEAVTARVCRSRTTGHQSGANPATTAGETAQGSLIGQWATV